MGIKTFGRIGLASLLIISQFVGIASLTLQKSYAASIEPDGPIKKVIVTYKE